MEKGCLENCSIPIKITLYIRLIIRKSSDTNPNPNPNTLFTLQEGKREGYNIRFLEMRKLRHSSGKAKPTEKRSQRVRHSASVNFDTFLFVDNITNSRITLKDVRKHYQWNHRPSQHKLKQQQDVNALSECLSTLKSTKLFQMDSLRSKLFRSLHVKKDEPEDLTNTKRGLRHLIEASIDELSLRELRECFADPSKRVQPKIIALQSLSAHQMTSSNIEAILSTSNHQPSEPKPSSRVILQESIFEFKEEGQLMEKADNYLRNNLRRNTSHLIKPEPQKELYEKLFSACKNAKIPRKSYAKQIQKEDTEGVFKPIKKGAAAAALEAKLSSKIPAVKDNEREAVFAVENNLFFDIQMLLIMDRQLSHARDPQGNSLLHIAAKNRNQELFILILKRTGPTGLTSKNNLGRTPLDLAKLYGATSIIQFCENYSPYS